MDPGDFAEAQRSHVIRAPTDHWAFVPPPLPPDLDLDLELIGALSAADRAIGELGGVGRWLPEPHLLIRPFLRREAVLSSKIEGTEATLTDLVLFEADAPTPDHPDVREVFNYVRALEHATAPGRSLPLSLRLIREMHRTLMTGVRGGYATPGEFRRSQNWIGPPGCVLNDATYVPPPVEQMHACLDAFERYLHESSDIPPLLRVALIHYQFEAIHPFLDGNGRVGRLLISLLLIEWGLLPKPLLYLSAYFEANRSEYYDRLLAVSRAGDWLGWARFFLNGVADGSADVIDRARRLQALREEYHRRLQVTRASALLLKLVDHLFAQPAIRIAMAEEVLGVTFRAASLNVGKLVDAGILQEITGRERNRVFVAHEILGLL
ncbi:MAG: Fic family protein [Actinomycetota bacterium]